MISMVKKSQLKYFGFYCVIIGGLTIFYGLFEQKFQSEVLQEGMLFLIDKPLGWTSFQAVNKIRWHLKNQTGLKKLKVGHAGTLDPLAYRIVINLYW